MSGDVQPKKRKEKRRKRAEEEYHIQRIRRASLEDDDAGTPPPMLVNPLEQSMENVTLHVHKEGGTGGHWCARIIFFALFTVLIGLVGVIIFEYRGTTDVDTPVASSRWAIIFDGWVDDVLPLHEAESHSVDKHEEDKEEDEGLGSESVENEEDDENDDDEDENAANQEKEEDEEEEDEGNEDDDEDNSPEQNRVDDENEYENRSEDDEGFEDDNEDDEEDIGVLDEVEYEESLEANGNEEEEEEEDEDEDADEDEDVENISVPDLDVSIEGIHHFSKQEEDDELDYEFVGIPHVNEIDDDSAEPLEEIEEEEPEEVINEIQIEPLVDEITEEESTSVAVKFGVGVALVVAAHFVLVRRWNNVDAELVAYSQEIPDLTRRNTIVPPGNVKQLIITGNLSQKQQAQEMKNKYRDLQNENVQLITNKIVSPVGSQKVVRNEPDVMTGSQLKTKESQEIVTSESERFSGTENESDYDYDEDELDDEEIEEEEEEEDEEEEEEEEEDEEGLDDSQLVAKLEAKYGKLPTPSQSEEEEEDESEEEDEEEEEEEVDEKRVEEIENWKRSNAPKTVHSGGTDKSKDNNRAKELSKSRQGTSAPRGGHQAADIVHSEDHNELRFQEEIENWLAGDLDN